MATAMNAALVQLDDRHRDPGKGLVFFTGAGFASLVLAEQRTYDPCYRDQITESYHASRDAQTK